MLVEYFYLLPIHPCGIVVAKRVDDARGEYFYPAPRGFVRVRLCAMSGRLATDACEKTVTEWIRPGQEPLDECVAHLKVGVDSRSGLLATRAPPGSRGSPGSSPGTRAFRALRIRRPSSPARPRV